MDAWDAGVKQREHLSHTGRFETDASTATGMSLGMSTGMLQLFFKTWLHMFLHPDDMCLIYFDLLI